MKDARFTELVNLCLDHQLSPSEAAELEAELLRSPARRREYREWCRLQEACVSLFEREMAHAPASFALERSLLEVERMVSEPPRPAYGRRLTVALAGCAGLAACLTLALVLIRPVSNGSNLKGLSGSGLAAVPASRADLALSGAFVAPVSAASDGYQAVANLSDWHAPGLTAAPSVVPAMQWIQNPGLAALTSAPGSDAPASTLQLPAGLGDLKASDHDGTPEVSNILFQFTK
jgi:anti-sigma factor RsiW